MEIGSWVLVTTDRRGVFFGRLLSNDGTSVVLEECRNCRYWSTETQGFLGLAAHGPADGSIVGPAAPKTQLSMVTSISLVSDRAVEKWHSTKSS